ncbi:hypothetical protein PC123_g28492 [Phytophthora cactorum]|nr:hypothetical protein PC123_g28492 [Phytophthora cactorum]
MGAEAAARESVGGVHHIEAGGHREAVVALPHAAWSRDEAAADTTVCSRRPALVLEGAPRPPVFVLEVLLHVPQHVAVRQPLVVVRYAKLQRKGGCAGRWVSGRASRCRRCDASVARGPTSQAPS